MPPALFPGEGAKTLSAFQEPRIHEWTQRAPRGGLERGRSKHQAGSALGCPCRYGTERERETRFVSWTNLFSLLSWGGRAASTRHWPSPVQKERPQQLSRPWAPVGEEACFSLGARPGPGPGQKEREKVQKL